VNNLVNYGIKVMKKDINNQENINQNYINKNNHINKKRVKNLSSSFTTNSNVVPGLYKPSSLDNNGSSLVNKNNHKQNVNNNNDDVYDINKVEYNNYPTMEEVMQESRNNNNSKNNSNNNLHILSNNSKFTLLYENL
jgi:hypothetical protein